VKKRSQLLVTTPQDLAQKYNVDAKVEHEVVKIDRQAKEVLVRDLKGGREYREPYDRLILSTGAAALLPPVPGSDSDNLFLVKTVPDTDKIKVSFFFHFFHFLFSFFSHLVIIFLSFSSFCYLT